MKILRIGDPHIKPSNLEDAEKLFHFINDQILEHRPDRVEILGDLFHTHSIVRLEVMEFWDGWLDVLSSHENTEIIILVGNHDMASNQENAAHALLGFKRVGRRWKNIKIVDLPRVEGIYGYMPYIHDGNTFIDLANGLVSHGAKILVCHQSFAGSQFESGTYDSNGIDPSGINFNLIISGHIHKRQVITGNGKTIIYPGTPKWDTMSDANEDKGIWLYEHDDTTGAIISEQLIRTAGVITKIVSLVWTEGSDLPAIPSGCKVGIELIGSSDWVNQQKKALKGQVAIKTKITDRVDKTTRQVGNDFLDFVKNLFVSTADREHLLKFMQELKIV